MNKYLVTWMLLGLCLCGCTMNGHGTNDPNLVNDDPAYQLPTPIFSPNQVNILPLTQFVKSEKSAELDYVRVYVELLDDFQSPIKAPGIFRFELSERALRTVNPIGKNIQMWPDIDLTKLDNNNKYWRDFLRTYEFRLDLQHILQGHFILEVTFFTPEGKRLKSHKTISLGG